MSYKINDKLKSYADKINPDENNKIDTFLKSLDPTELEQFKSLKLDSDKEKFYNKIILKRTNLIRTKMNTMTADSYIAADPSDITAENLKNFLEAKSAEELERELAVGINEMTRHYTSEAMKVYTTKRNRRTAEGALDLLVSLDELNVIKSAVRKKLVDNPVYKMSLLFINNTSGSITVFNDKMIESKRDLEIYKEMYCNELGMTSESFDNWQDYVKITIKEKCIDSPDGFSNLGTFDKEWHKSIFKRFYKKVEGFKKGDIVYTSDFLNALKIYDEEKDKTCHNEITKNIMSDLEKGIANSFGLETDETKTFHVSNDSAMTNTIKHKRDVLKKRKTTLKTITESSKKEESITKPDIFKNVNNVVVDCAVEQIENIPLEDVKTTLEATKTKSTTLVAEESIIEDNLVIEDKKDKQEIEDAVIISQPIYKKPVEVVDEIDEEIIINSEEKEPIKEEDIITPNKVLMKYRNIEIEDKVLVRYERKPDTNLLRKSTISDPKARIQMYKNSAVVNGFRLYLPYSGYEVIVKKLQDKSKISYLFSLLSNAKTDVSTVIEQEVFKILFDSLEFPDMEYLSFSTFTKNLSPGDVPILIVTLAMTNVAENEDGRVIINVSSLKCSNPDCEVKNIPVQPIKVDLYDLFSKIYPIDLYVENYQSKLKDIRTVEEAFRNGPTGLMTSLSVLDEDKLCKHTILLSKPTVYKEYSVKNQSSEVNFNLIKEDILERPEFYSETSGYKGLADFIEPLTFSTYSDKYNSLTAKIASLEQSADEFTDDEITAIKEEMDVDMVPVTLMTRILMNSLEDMKSLLNICKYVDAVKIVTNDEDALEVSVVDNHDNLTDLIRIYSNSPTKLIKAINKQIEKLDEDINFEYEDVYYTSETMKGKFADTVYKEYDKETTDKYVKYLKDTIPDITEEQIEQQLLLRDDEKDFVKEGKCICGSDTFYINYINIIFFSIFNRLEVMKG